MTLEIGGETIPYTIKNQTDRNQVSRQYYRASVIVSENPFTGKQEKREITAPTEAKLRSKILALQRFRSLADGSVLPLKQYLESWLERNKVFLKPTTVSTYQYLLTHYVSNRIGETKMADLSEESLSSYFQKLIADRGLPIATDVRAFLSRPFREAASKYLTAGNPLARIRLPKPQPAAILPLSPEECQRLLALCEQDEYGGPIALALLLGLRIGEVIGLGTDAIDLPRRLLRVRRQVSETHSGFILQQTTKNNSERLLYLDDSSIYWIQRELRLLRQKQDRAGAKWHNEHQFLFTNRNGQFIQRAVLREHLKYMIYAIGRENFKFHHLRHTAATIVHEETHDVNITKQLLGHKRYDSTGHYIHSSQEKMKEASLAISAYVSAASQNLHET